MVKRRTKDSERDRGFAQGVAWAVGVLERSFGETSLAANLIGESGMKLNDFRRACDLYDYNVVARLARTDSSLKRHFARTQSEKH